MKNYINTYRRVLPAYGGVFIDLVCGIAIQSLAYRYLGLSVMGEFAIWQISYIYSQIICEYGINTVATREVSSEHDDNERCYSHFQYLRILLIIPACIFFIAVTYLIDINFSISKIGLGMLAICVTAMTPTWLFFGRHEISRYNAFQGVARLVSLAFVYSIVQMFPSINTFLISFVISSVVLLFTTHAYKHVAWPNISIYSPTSKDLILHTIRRCAPQFTSSIAYNLSRYSNSFILSKILPLDLLGVISACEKIVTALVNLRTPFAQVMLVQLTRRQHLIEKRRLAHLSCFQLLGPYMAISTVISVFSEEIAWTFVGGSGYLQVSYVLWIYVFLAASNALAGYAISYVLPALDLERFSAFIFIFSATVSGVSIYFVYPSLGILGVPLALGVSDCLAVGLAMLVISVYPAKSSQAK